MHNLHARPCSGPELPEETEQESLVKIEDRITPESRDFYKKAITTVRDAGIPLLVGGAFAMEIYTGISRYTKDFDIIVRASDAVRVLDVLAAAGYATEVTAPHWLAKACSGDIFVDVIFGEANGVSEVDDEWFAQSARHTILGLELDLCPVEEIICSKAFVMDRDRCDGADVAHLLLMHAEKLDWNRILHRFGRYWHVLLSHLLLFTFIYPSEAHRIPTQVLQTLNSRFEQELKTPPASKRICRGTLLSMTQYRTDVRRWGYEDARDLKDTIF